MSSMSLKGGTLGSRPSVAARLTPPLGSEDHVAGPAGAPLELVMYGDFQCPYCSAAQPIVRRVRERLGDRLRFAFRHLPLPALHPDAQRAAEASESAAAQGAFWPMHDALYAQRGRLGLADVLRAAAEAGVDPERVRADLEAGIHAARVERDVESARAGEVTGTPGFFANGVRVEGSFDAQSLLAALERQD
jgi:protein-disulfide isomerase